jgi:hypothetical protein
LIHNVANTDDVVGVSDRATDTLFVLFNTEGGRAHLRGLGIDGDIVDALVHLGYSAIANMLAAIKIAKWHRLGSDDVIVTVATDGAEMYGSELDPIIARDHGGTFGASDAAAAFARFLEGVDTDHVWELGEVGRRRIFNLGYYTWVEQQGIPFDTFEARRDRSWWDGLRPFTDRWDEMIEEFNERTGV